MKKRILVIIGIVLLCFTGYVVTSCAGLSNKEKQGEVCDSCNDSLVAQRLLANPRLALQTIDSLEAAGMGIPQRLYGYRALAYNQLGDIQNLIKWGRKALEGNALLESDDEMFYQVSDKLFTVLVNQGETESALAVVQRGYDAAKENTETRGLHWAAIMLHGIGYCEMQMGHIDEAERCFSQSYIGLKQMASSDSSLFNLRTCARVAYNIVDAYNSTEQYDKAAAWIESAEDALEKMAASPECPQALKNDFMGGLAIQKAIVLLQEGRRAEADASYATAMQLDYANSSYGIVESAVYLERANRMAELMALMPRIDSLSNAWGNPASLAHWEKYQKKETL